MIDIVYHILAETFIGTILAIYLSTLRPSTWSPPQTFGIPHGHG